MNLYRLEWMKFRISAYLWAVFGIFTGLLMLGILFLFIFQAEGGAAEEAELFADWNGLLALVTALSFACFSILSAVMGAKVIVSEYCGKNAVILLSYPVRRKKMLEAKCLMLSGITTAFAWLCNILVICMMYLTALISGIMPRMDTEHFFIIVLLSSFLTGVLSSAAGMAAAAFGWKKRSVSAAVVCALLIVCALTNCIVISPGHIVQVLLGMSAVFVVTADFIYHILAGGIEKMEV